MITLHFGFLDSYSLLNILLVGSYLYAWARSSGQARALYGRMAAVFALYSVGDTLNTYQVIRGEAFSGDWLDLSYSVPFALATVTRRPVAAVVEPRRVCPSRSRRSGASSPCCPPCWCCSSRARWPVRTSPWPPS